MNRHLRSLYLRIVLHPGFVACRRTLAALHRRLTFRQRVVDVFLQLDDPHSYLLSYYLQHVVRRYDQVRFRYHLCQALRGDFMPQPGLQVEQSLRDGRMLARTLGVPFLDQGEVPTAEYRRPLLSFLAGEQAEEDFADTFHKALTVFWRGDAEGARQLLGRIQPEDATTGVLIGRNQLLLRKLGHYNCATMHYAGEWYWGIDRLSYLTDRLDAEGLGDQGGSAPELESLAAARQFDLPTRLPPAVAKLPPLEMYHSFRSPYSYIALARVFELADAYGFDLRVRPVLPMVMRGMTVPRSKLLYIVRDANREARKLKLPFGKISDAAGAASERCIAVFYLAQDQGRERKFLAAAGEAIWSRGMDLATDGVLQAVTERAGLEWPDVQAALANEAWRDEVAANRDALTGIGLWGVPSFAIGKLALWGQDRVWLLARHLEAACRKYDEAAQ